MDCHALPGGDSAAGVADALLVVGVVAEVELFSWVCYGDHLDVLLELGALSLVATVVDVGLHRCLDCIGE
eukprot:7155199-Pyramimonas_sp.AAC.1